MPYVKRRIGYLINQYPAVSHTFIRREIFALERLGIEVDRIALKGWDIPLVDSDDLEERAKTRYVQQDGIFTLLSETSRTAVTRPVRFLKALGSALAMSRNAMRPLPYHLVYLAQACRIQRWLAEAGATHLHAHFGTNPAEIACLVQTLGGPSYSFTNHGSNELDGAPWLHFPRKIGQSKFAVAVSSFCRSQILRTLPQEQWDKLKVIHCGLDAGYFDEDPSPLPQKVSFLCVGRLSPEKGHFLLLDAFAEIYANHPETRLVFAGDGPMRPQIEARIDALGLNKAVEITGWIDAKQVKSELGRTTALVQPSLIEGLPVVIMEAMARKRPVISTFIAGIPELVLPGETGWLVPAGEIIDLAKAMEQVIATDRETLIRMGETGHARARDRHLVDNEAKKLAALFFEEAS